MIRIAIVEDQPEMRAALRTQVQAACRDGLIEEFASGEALLAAETPFDVYLLDIKLKGQDGMQTAKALRVRDAGCAIIFITSYPGRVYEAFDVQAAHYLLKPVDNEQLAVVLARVL